MYNEIGNINQCIRQRQQNATWTIGQCRRWHRQHAIGTTMGWCEWWCQQKSSVHHYFKKRKFITGTVVENDVYRNLYKKFGSLYLLPVVIRKSKTKDKERTFDKIYFDHLINDRRKKLIETGLKTFYKRTLSLLEKSSLLSNKCEILLPFNTQTFHHLHKAWNNFF